jgi:riboflavin kinase/FMN adenylyltransferase
MIIHHSLYEYANDKPSVLTIGTFDGVHLGHQKVLNRLKKDGLSSVVLTFFPHPRMVLFPKEDIKLIQTITERCEALAQSKVDHLIIHPFDIDLANLGAEDFVKNILVDKLQIKKIIVGYDHRFGKNRSANFDDLVNFGKKYHFEVEKIEAKEVDEQTISSTKIRRAIQNGDMQLAKDYLGFLFSISGEVTKGKSLGRTIGFPTANIVVKEAYKLLPKKGVYLVQSLINHQNYFGMLNIGHNPTTDFSGFFIEVYFFDLDLDLYRQTLKIEFIDFLRDEQKFESIDALKSQLQKDKKACLKKIKELSLSS